MAILQGDNQIPPLLLELNKRQTVVRQMSHRGGSHPLDRTTVRYSGVVLPLAYKTPANFSDLAPEPAGAGAQALGGGTLLMPRHSARAIRIGSDRSGNLVEVISLLVEDCGGSDLPDDQ